MKTTTKRKEPRKQGSDNLKLVHKIIEYQFDMSAEPGSLGAPPKGKVIETMMDLDKAFKKCEKLNEKALSNSEGCLVGYYVKSEPTS